MKVLITGIAGMIGHHAARVLLDAGYDIRGIDRRPPPPDVLRRIDMRYGDITDTLSAMQAVQDCDCIIHTAAIPNNQMAGHNEIIQTNVVGTHQILYAAQQFGVQRTILTSSIAALGFAFPTTPCLPDSFPIRVDQARRPQDLYGLTKVMCEEATATAVRSSDLTAIIFRPPLVMDAPRALGGGWLDTLLYTPSKLMKDGFWAYIELRDMARAYRLALEADVPKGCHLMYTMAEDIVSEKTPQELLAEHYPDLASMGATLSDSGGFYDLGPAKSIIGFTAEWSWRDAKSGRLVQR